ncbi:SDR family oxidoreductase [Nocardioides sp. JQ2195]|nr:SDR family oxidoreductase [Nocardioides sp. JQ2195]
MDGKVVLVAGGGSGIGARTAQLLAERGAAVAVADVAMEAAEQVARSIASEGGTATALHVDLGDEESVRGAFSHVEDTYGQLHGLFNVAADMRVLREDTDLLDLDLAVWDRTMAVALRGYVLTIREALPRLIDSGGGSIVNTSSGAAFVGEPQRPAYAAAKAAVGALTRHVASRWGRQGIRCNAVAPGLVNTPSARTNSESFWDAAVTANPSGRLGEPLDIATAAAFLLGGESTWVNGQVIGVDGGSVMR